MPPARLAAVATEALETEFPVVEYPPLEWFAGPPAWVDEWRAEHGAGSAVQGGILRMTVTDEGRVGGYFYDRGTCIFGRPGECPGPSPTGYRGFHQNDVVVEDGSIIMAGAIGNTGGHTSRLAPLEEAQAVLNDPRLQMIRVMAGDDEHGGWIAGALVPANQRRAAGVDPLTYGHVAMLRLAALSGTWYKVGVPGGFPADWWERNGVTRAAAAEAEGFDSLGPQLVTRPALPLVRAVRRVANAEPDMLVGGCGGIPDVEGDPSYVAPDAHQEDAVPPEPPAATAAAPPPAQAPPARPPAARPPAGGGDGEVTVEQLDERLKRVEAAIAGMSRQQQAALDARLASIAKPALPAPAAILAGVPVDVLNDDEVAWLAAATPEQRTEARQAAELSAGAINNLPDSAFAYIEPGGSKDDQGKTTPRSKRHFPVHDEAHVRNALGRLPQSEFESQARGKVCAAAKKFDIQSDYCSSD